jgi:hypothetical protein
MPTRSLLPTWPASGRVTRTARTGLRTPGFRGCTVGPKETIETQLPALDDPLDIASMTREQRDALKRRLLPEHPHLAEQLGIEYTG